MNSAEPWDQENGTVLWEMPLATGTEGVPATHEVDGRRYVVVCVGAGEGTVPPRLGALPPPGAGQYIVLALPEEE